MKQLRVCAVDGCPELTLRLKCDKHHTAHRNGSSNKRPHGRRWAELRRIVLKNEPYCRVKGPRCTTFAAEVDHIIPLSLGGHPTDHSNLQPLCHNCHVDKTRLEMRGMKGLA